MSAAPTNRSFADDCRAAAAGLRTALAVLYVDVKADPAKPQDVSRRFGLNKNLTWKIAKILQSVDSLEAVPHVPGAEGMRLLLGAMREGGASAAALDLVIARFADFERMTVAHGGDRPTLELLMDGMARGGALEVSRKLAFRGNSGVWGLQARVRSMLELLTPNPDDPSMLDGAVVGGIHDLRRLRSVQGWPLFRFHRYGQGAAASPDSPRRLAPLEMPRTKDEPALIMRSFCSPPGAEVHSDTEADGTVVHRLVDGPIGQQGAVTLAFGMREDASVPRYASSAAETEYGEMGALVTMPIEHVLIDILVHRDMLGEFRPELVVYGRPHGNLDLDPVMRENYRLPIEGSIERFDDLSEVGTELVHDRPQMIDLVLRSYRLDPDDFTLFRAIVQYPPMPSTVMVRYVLPLRP
jgi:hypothetical protein